MGKKITILGSTGSIGTQALEVIERSGDKFEIIALSGGDNIELISAQTEKFRPEKVCVKSAAAAAILEKHFPDVIFVHGEDGLRELCSDTRNDLILVAVSGKIGLKPTLTAIDNKIDIALANKETLVTAGDIVMRAVKKSGINFLPVDSEHSAIFQCLHDKKYLRRLLITASGGPFLKKSVKEMFGADVSQALAHPRWNMGKKITVDSATLMNKGFEVIEAHHLFDVSYDNISIVIHPESYIHSAIEYNDGSVIAQLGVPSMHIPIQYAVCYPERIEGLKTNSFDFSKVACMHFEQPDFEKFPLPKLAIECGKCGGTYPAALNAADEEAVSAFLEGKIPFSDISYIVNHIIDTHINIENPLIDDIFQTGEYTAALTRELIERRIKEKI